MLEGRVGDELRNVFEHVFGRLIPDLTRETTPAQLDGWDSLRHAGLIIAIEDHFSIEYPEKKYFDFKNVGDIADLVFGLVNHERSRS